MVEAAYQELRDFEPLNSVEVEKVGNNAGNIVPHPNWWERHGLLELEQLRGARTTYSNAPDFRFTGD